MNDLSYRRVAALLKLFPSENEVKKENEKKESAHRHVRDLNEYKQLCLTEQKEVQNEPSVT
jgi:hypothetical protein